MQARQCVITMSLISYVHFYLIIVVVFLPLACMFLEDSTVGHEVWRESFLSLLNKVSELFLVVLQQESLRDGPLCYIAVKVHKELYESVNCRLVSLFLT